MCEGSDKTPGQVTAVKWDHSRELGEPRRPGAGEEEAAEGSVGPGFSRQGPEILLAGVGSVPEGPSRCNSTLRPSRGFRLCKNTRTHTVPSGPWPSLGRGLEPCKRLVCRWLLS